MSPESGFDMEDRYFELEGHRVHYTVQAAGSGTRRKPVLLLHGFTEAVFVWRELSAFLARGGYDVLCLDLAGHGRTETFARVHGMELQASLAKAVLEQDGLEKAVIIGHSMGGYVAAAFGCLYPHMVKGMGFFHSHPGPDTPQAAENRRRSLELLHAGKTGFLAGSLHTLFAPGTESRYALQIEALHGHVRSMGAQAVAAAQQGMLERESRLSVYDLDVPFLFIIGTKDIRMDTAKIMAQTLLPRQACVQLLPVGHMGMYERPRETEAFIAGYLGTMEW